MLEIYAITLNENFKILASVGVEVLIGKNEEDLANKFQEVFKKTPKIIIYDLHGEKIVQEIIENHDENIYPIFLKLPTGVKHEDVLSELKALIEKSIGISVL